MSEFYSAQIHVFDNPYSNNVYIDRPEGKTLYVNGIATGNAPGGVDGSVQFNSLGDLAGDSTFIYDTLNNILDIPHIEIDDAKHFTESDTLGYSTLYQGPNLPFPQLINSTFTTAPNFGTDLQLAKLLII